MAIGTYQELKAAVASWMQRGTALDTVIPDFIALAESQIRQDVRCRAMETSATGTLTQNTLAFPTRFAEARRVTLDDRPQRYVTPEEWARQENYVTDRYTIIGQTFYFQSTSADYKIDFYQWFAPFSANNDTNWLLTNHPDVYLFASLAEASVWTRDDPQMWVMRYQAALAKLKKAENSMTGPLVIRPETVE